MIEYTHSISQSAYDKIVNYFILTVKVEVIFMVFILPDVLMKPVIVDTPVDTQVSRVISSHALVS